MACDVSPVAMFVLFGNLRMFSDTLLPKFGKWYSVVRTEELKDPENIVKDKLSPQTNL